MNVHSPPRRNLQLSHRAVRFQAPLRSDPSKEMSMSLDIDISWPARQDDHRPDS